MTTLDSCHLTIRSSIFNIRYLLVCALLSAASLIAPAFSLAAGETAMFATVRKDAIKGTLGTYCRASHLPNGQFDADRLLKELVDIHANTYCFCIHGTDHDWDDLQKFLPMAREKGIRIWGSVVPPSESPPRSKKYAEPFRLDYQRWAVEFAKLSVRETNLVAWSIDDFSHNQKFFTKDYMKKMLDDSRAINPRLAFVPCCYFKEITPAFVSNSFPFLDGILFPYRHESGGANLKDPSLVESEVHKIRALTGEAFPVLVDVYATAHSSLGQSTPEYVEQVMIAGKKSADGVMIYCHQDPNQFPQKYAIIKKLFTKWSDNLPADK